MRLIYITKMSFFSKLFSFVSIKKSISSPEETDSASPLSRTPLTSTESYHESGTFSRESRVDQIESPYSNILTTSCDDGKGFESSSSIISRRLDQWNPETCVRLLRMPSVQNYSGLFKLISKSDRNWMVEFLDMGGLQVLFESVDRLGNKNSLSTRLERTLLLLQCVKCLKAVISSHIALEHIIRQRTYVKKIADVLSSCNPLVKKQLFDFLATLCVFSEDGHYLTLDVFETYRVAQKLRYKFAVLLDEIKQAEVMPYVGAVLGLINCIILGACGFRFRTRIRNEFLALGLHDLMESLKQIPEEEVELQCSVFLKSQMADEEYARSMGIHSSFSHFALFQVLLDKIEDTPLSASFLVLLQNLNQLDPTDMKTDYVWSMLEEVTERALNGTGSAVRNWMLNECRHNSLKSTATQTCFYLPSSISLEESITYPKSLCDEDYEKDSVKSFSSRDSGVPVSRNQSFASNGPQFSECSSLKQSISCPVEKSTSTEFSHNSPSLSDVGLCNFITENFKDIQEDEKENTKYSKDLIKRRTFSLTSTNCSTKQQQAHLLRKNSQGAATEISPLTFRSESLSPKIGNLVEEGKIKKSLFSFFNRSKKYTLPKSLPTVKANPPSPDTPNLAETVNSRIGMTSLDVKRSRKQTQLSSSLLNDSDSVISDDKGTFDTLSSIVSKRDIESQSSLTSTAHPEASEHRVLSSKEQVEQLTKPTPSQTIVPPPPPPPPPTFCTPQVEFRRKSQCSLAVPTSQNLRSSWSGTPTVQEFEKVEKRQHYTLPLPKSKMKILNWNKIPSARVSVDCIWNEINQESEKLEVNFDEMEKLFCQSERQKDPKTRQRKRVSSEISLLDNKRCLSIGVFLKQFKGGYKEVIEYIRLFKHKEIGAERLRTLLNLLPDSNEVKLLNSYTGDCNKLGQAEKFLVQLLAVARYDCVVEGLLLQEEFPITVQVLHDSVQSLLESCQELLTNKGFKSFLRLVLVTGNFMNTGSYAGNAVGFHLSTLPKLLETRANRPRITLLHYLVEEFQRKDEEGIKFTNELLAKLSRCSRLTVESVSVEIAQLDKTMQKLSSHAKEDNGQLKKYFSRFIENGLKHLTMLKIKMKEINKMSVQLANHFCEDEKKFKLEECFNVVSVFCAKINAAISLTGSLTTGQEITSTWKYDGYLRKTKLVKQLKKRK